MKEVHLMTKKRHS